MSMISGSSSRPINNLKSCLTKVDSTFTVGSGAYSNTTTTVTHASSTAIRLGMTVTSSKANMPANTFVVRIDSATQFTISAAVTGTQSGCTLTFAAGYVGALQEPGRQTGDVEIVSESTEEAAYTSMRALIHAPGVSNPFHVGDPNQPPNAPINLLTGCKVYKRVDTGGGTGTEYWRTFLYTKDGHGLTVDSGSSVANLVASGGSLSDYGAGFSLSNGCFDEPLRVLSNPTSTTARFNFGQTRGGYQTVVVGGTSLASGAFQGMMDLVSDTAHDTPLVGDEITMPASNRGKVMNFGMGNAFMYYVLDADNIVLYTNLIVASVSGNSRLNHEEDRTFLLLGRGGTGGADQFASAVTVNPTSLAITTSFSGTQVIPSSVNMIEFWATGGDTTIEIGIHKHITSGGSSFFDSEIDYTTSSPSIVIPQDTRMKVPINTFEVGGFRAKTSNGSGDTLHWNYIVG